MDKVICPWCGAEMIEAADTGEFTWFAGCSWYCEKCKAASPLIQLTDEMDMSECIKLALSAAMQRYGEPANGCDWCTNMGDYDRFEFYHINHDGHTEAHNHMVSSAVAEHCPKCGRRMEAADVL